MTEQEVHEKAVDRLLDMHRDDFLDMFDAAVDRWLDKQFSRFGRWALTGIIAALFVWGVKLYVQYGGVK